MHLQRSLTVGGISLVVEAGSGTLSCEIDRTYFGIWYMSRGKDWIELAGNIKSIASTGRTC